MGLIPCGDMVTERVVATPLARQQDLHAGMSPAVPGLILPSPARAVPSHSTISRMAVKYFSSSFSGLVSS